MRSAPTGGAAQADETPSGGRRGSGITERADTAGEGEDGAGKDGAGRDGAGRDGAGRDGAGRDGAGKDGAGKDGAGKDGASRVSDAGRAPRTGLAAPVLVLNRSFQPVRITTARHAFLLLYLGRGRALDAGYEPRDFDEWSAMSGPMADDDELIGTPRGEIRVPRVLLLTTYNRVPSAPLRLSRRNIFLRDDFTCQYCGVRPGMRELNLDHVIPRSRGGRSTWDNLATSCRTCNLRKGWATPEEAHMPLNRKPVRPGWSMALMMAAPARHFAQWEPFLASLSR